MPYFVYRFPADNKTATPRLQERHSSYRAAKDHVKELRDTHPDEDLNNFRLIFAEDEDKARILLTTKREKSQVEEWEN